MPSMDGSLAVGNNRPRRYLTKTNSPGLTDCGTPGNPTLYPLTWLGRLIGPYGTAASYVLTRKRSASFPAFDALELFVDNLESDPVIFAFERQSPVPKALLGRVTGTIRVATGVRAEKASAFPFVRQTSWWVLASQVNH